MWQKTEILKFTLILLLLTLFVVKPNLGLHSKMGVQTNFPKKITQDMNIDNLVLADIGDGKMRLAVEKPLPKRTGFPKPKRKIEVEVASLTLFKPTVPGEVDSLIEKYAREYSADPQIMKSIAHCESGYRADAVNGNFGGMYQFLASTWSSNRNAMGLDPNPELRFNSEEAIKTAAFKMGRDGYNAWPSCYQQALMIAQAH